VIQVSRQALLHLVGDALRPGAIGVRFDAHPLRSLRADLHRRKNAW
jgi:hypothetical protein